MSRIAAACTKQKSSILSIASSYSISAASSTPSAKETFRIVEVGARDGLQNEQVNLFSFFSFVKIFLTENCAHRRQGGADQSVE
jgi:hypothetical protein